MTTFPPDLGPGALLVVNLYYASREPPDMAAYHALRFRSLQRGLLLVEVASVTANNLRVKRRPELDQEHACPPLLKAASRGEFYLPKTEIGISARHVASVTEAEHLDAAWRLYAGQMVDSAREVIDISSRFWNQHWIEADGVVAA